ncbi:hypothetical protein MMC18_004253 [Xylographa bjoerkii]|nr:hypothetical protein [Xylographa bjoerkii]
MSSPMSLLAVPLLGAAADMTTVALKEGSSLLKHRREHPVSLPTKSSSANVTVFGLFNNVQPQTDNRDMSDSGENKNTLLRDFTKGAAIGVGIGVGLAGALWLVNKVSKQKEPCQRPLRFAMPAYESGWVVEEETEDGEEEVQSLAEEQKFLTLM